MNNRSFSPNQFLRARRPERFSDSVAIERPILDRSSLEYHLDTLSNRGQETQFERFARRLAELEVCPNLLPHTGPTGGGDSKVDTETYPVADELSLGWYMGVGREAASERWGFAISAKKKWRDKISSDVAKIASTGRGYVKAFFVTNQYVPDKTRAEVEDKLRTAHGLEVRIFDRTWILDRVFAHHHEALAIEELGITASVHHEMRRGPLDTQREQDLQEIEHRILAALQHSHQDFQLVDDCLQAAILAREIERPRVQVEGLFERSERVASKFGTEHQQLVTAYQRAWTALFWYEDYDQFSKLYATAEERAEYSRNAYHLQLLTNLWLVLNTAVQHGVLDSTEALLPQRTNTLTASLKRLSQEHDRLSTALQARTLLLKMRLASIPTEDADPILREIIDVVEQSESLVGYPLESLAEIVTELGFALGELPTYEELFETLLRTTSRRAGEIAAARALLLRGAQQLDAERPYLAIRTLGRALSSLHRHESRGELVRALYLCANAYERVGLLWAARGTLLVAASVAANEFWMYEDVTPVQSECYNRLKWVELQLARLPHILAWHELDRFVTMALKTKGYEMNRRSHDDILFDLLLGILLLKADIPDLVSLSHLPGVLDELGLFNAAGALLYSLGYEESVPPELIAGNADSMHAFFVKWRDQQGAQKLPTTLELCDTPEVKLSSKILGCRIVLESQNSSPCNELAESILAALEALLSTGMAERLVAIEPVLTISITRSDLAEQPFVFEMIDRNGRLHLDIRCPMFQPHSMSGEAQVQIRLQLLALLAAIISNAFLFADEEVIHSLLAEDLALARAIDFTTSFVTVGNLLGSSPKTRLAAWMPAEPRAYPLKRSQEWDAETRHASSKPSNPVSKPTIANGKPVDEHLGPERTKHTEMEAVSLIRERYWNRARWSGTMFLTNPPYPPVLAPMFEDEEAARQIFADWLQELGPEDEEERLRVTIIRGTKRSNPYAYRIVIGSNVPASIAENHNALVTLVSRANTMTPASDENLRRFLRSYEAAGCYLLAGATADQRNPLPVSDVFISKRELHVREAWQIGRHDPDVAGISEDDDPVIPADQPEAPVLEVLRWLRS